MQVKNLLDPGNDGRVFELGGLVMDLEMTISNVHKMMIYFGQHWEMQRWKP
jgi:hypothetical protein